MSYTLVSLNTNRGIICSNELWISALDSAKKNGWDPEGTVYDFDFTVEDESDPNIGTMAFMMQIITIHMFRVKWDRNYTDRENQIVTDDDTYYFRQALIDIPGMEELVKFLDDGSFRILSV